MIYERPLPLQKSFSLGPATTFQELATTAFDEVRYSAEMIGYQQDVETAYDTQIDKIKSLTGVELENPYRISGLISREQAERGEAGDAWSFFEKRRGELAKQHPKHEKDIQSNFLAPVFKEQRRRERASNSAQDRSDLTFHAFGMPMNPVSLAGGFAGMMTDPQQAVINIIFGPTGRAAAGAKGLVWAATKNAAANMAVEVAQQPLIQHWRDKAGLPNGLGIGLTSVAAAGVLGFGLDAGVRGGIRGVQKSRGRVEKLDDDGNIIGWQTPDEAAAAANLKSRDETFVALDDAARNSDNETVRKASDGDAAALRQLAEESGAAEQPAIKGALDQMDLDEALPMRLEGVDDGAHLQRMADLLRHADDPEANPIPVRPDPVPETRTPRLADDAPAPTGRKADIDGKPVYFRPVELKDTITDAAQFQFKRGGDTSGATGRLSGVERWDPVAAGRAVIYERQTGELIVADAHQRRDLATRLEEPTPVEAVVFREADGWQPGDVRALAAKKNLQEGSGTIIDAAAIIRERPDIVDASMPLRSDMMRQARSLARLSDEAFDMVAGGVLPANHAAMIGDLVPDASRHASLAGELAKLEPNSAQQARLYLSELLSAPVHAEEQLTLLGALRVERSLMRERVGVLDQALKTLRQDARVFSLLTKEAGRIEDAGNRLAGDSNASRATEAGQVEAMIEALAMQRGAVSDWLNDAARSVAQGTAKTKAASAFVGRVRGALEDGGLNRLMSNAEPEPRAGGIDDVSGEAAVRQVEDLERELSREIEIAKDPSKHAEKMKKAQQQLFAQRAPIDFTDPSSYRLTAEANAQAGVIRAGIDKVADRLPEGVKLRVEDRLVYGGQDIDGRYDPYEGVAYVALSSADPVKVARHEEVHVLRDLGLFSERDWQLLTNHARQFDLRKDYDIDTRYGEPYKTMFGDDAEARLIEETIAHMVADYNGGNRFGGAVDRLFEMVTNFLRGVRDALGVTGFRTAADVFEAIEKGDLGRGGDTAPPVSSFSRSIADADRAGDLADLVEACKR